MSIPPGMELRTSAPTTIIGMDKTKEMLDTYFRGIDMASFGLYINAGIEYATDIPPLSSKYRRKFAICSYIIGSAYEDWQFEINIPDGDAFFREIAIRLREYAKRQYDDRKIRDLIHAFCEDSELCCEA